MKLHPSQILAQCPLCQATYQTNEVRLIGEHGPTKLFHCSCLQCGHAVLAVVLEQAGWVSSVGMVTDLEAQDAMNFQDVAPISSDECIAFHRALQGQSKAFCDRLSLKKTG